MSTVRVEVEQRLAILTIDNPPVNALAERVREDLRAALDRLAQDAEVWCAILTAAGTKIFAAGADVTQFPGLTYETGLELVRRRRAWWDAIAGFPKPLIAAINGHALGGGLELALACDIRVASSAARVGLPETGLGLLPGGGGTQRLTRLVGAGRAKLMIFSGDQLPAAEAERLGIVEQVVPPEEVLPAARAIAQRILSRAPIAVQTAKRAINQGFELPLREALDFEGECFARLMGTEDKNEGVAAFLEKRSPVWKGA